VALINSDYLAVRMRLSWPLLGLGRFGMCSIFWHRRPNNATKYFEETLAVASSHLYVDSPNR
jgi:hypothetical protein